MSSNPVSYVIVAGEASGDILGASLIRAMKQAQPDVVIYGVGGKLMKDAGQEQWSDYQPLAIFGLFEVLKHIFKLLRFRKWLIAKTLESKAGMYIGIDAPDFNIGVEKRLKAKGLKTIHYVSPSIWAWREGRAKKFKGNVDAVLCLFPMEPPLYDKYDVPNVFIGHPLADEFDMIPDQAAAQQELGLTPAPYIGLLPGSRLGEIYRIAPDFLYAAIRILRTDPTKRFLIPMANPSCRDAMEKLLATRPVVANDETNPTDAEWQSLKDKITCIDGQSRSVMQAADSLILASGTAALEGMLSKRPMVVAYKVAPLTFRIATFIGLVKIDRYSLPNILAGDALVPELIQDKCNPSLIATTWEAQVNSQQRAAQMQQFASIHQHLKQGGATLAAKTVMEIAHRA